MNDKIGENNSPDEDSKMSGSREDKLSLRSLKTFDSFKYPAYRVYFGSMAGNWVTRACKW